MGLRQQILQQYGRSGLDYTADQIKNSIQQCSHLKHKALISFLYLTAARIEEVVKYKIKGELIGQPINKKQIIKTEKTLTINYVRILKRRSKESKNKTILTRSIPISLNPKHKPDKYFTTIFLEYLKNLEDEDKLWNITRQRAHQILEKVGLFPHLLRHSRVTILVKHYDFGIPQLLKFIGWNRADTAAVYTHLDVRDILQKLEE